MEQERISTIGDVAANRPLLISTLFALGLSALAVVSFLQSNSALANGINVANFAMHGLAAIAAPAALAAIAPTMFAGRTVYAITVATLLYATVWAIGNFTPIVPGAFLPTTSAMIVAGGLVVWFVMMRPLFGAVAGLAFVAPLTAILGAFGAASLLSLEASAVFEAAQANHVVGAITALSLALACVVGVSVAADFSDNFAKGQTATVSAARAAHIAIAPAVNVALLTVGVFGVGLFPGAQELEWSWRLIAGAAIGVGLAAAAVLFVTAATLSLSAPTELLAVNENHRRRAFRDLWQPLRLALPPSSAIAVTAILLIVTVVALFEAATTLSLYKVGLIAACGLAAALTYVSVRTGAFVLIALLIGVGLVDCGYELFGFAAPATLGMLCATVATAALYGQIGLAWRESRSPRRKAHESTEAAMIDGAYRYLTSGGFALAAFLIAGTSGLWPGGTDAAIYFGILSVFGLIIAAPIMTALGAISGRE